MLDHERPGCVRCSRTFFIGLISRIGTLAARLGYGTMQRTGTRVDGPERMSRVVGRGRPTERVKRFVRVTAVVLRVALPMCSASTMLLAGCAPDARAPEVGTIAGVVATTVHVEAGDSLIEARLAAVPKGFFVGPNGGIWLGRLFVNAEYGPAATEPVAVLTHAFWERLGGDPSMVGSRLVVEGVRRTVVGVTAPGFAVPDGVEIWVPIQES